jgi:hypothetical protein
MQVEDSALPLKRLPISILFKKRDWISLSLDTSQSFDFLERTLYHRKYSSSHDGKAG